MKSLAEHLGVIDPRKPEADQAVPELVDLTGAEFCHGVLNSREYRASILRRILFDELPPAVELRIMDMAPEWGKPVARMEHTGKDGKPIEAVTEIRRVIVHASQAMDEEDEPRAEVTH